MLRASNVDASDLDRAERRYRCAFHRLERIRTSLNDSSTAGERARQLGRLVDLA